MARVKRTLPALLASAVGLVVVAMVLTSNPRLDAWGSYLIDTAVLIAAFALILGLLNVLSVHARRIRERQPGRFYSVVLVAAMLLVLAAGLLPLSNRPSGPSQPAVQWVFENVQVPIQASLSALLVFFILSAAYRTLRVRNLESAVLLAVAVVVLAGQVTVGLVPILPELKDWILAVPVVAGVRGILLGVVLGTVLTSIRLLLGVEGPWATPGDRPNREPR